MNFKPVVLQDHYWVNQEVIVRWWNTPVFKQRPHKMLCQYRTFPMDNYLQDMIAHTLAPKLTWLRKLQSVFMKRRRGN